MKTDLSSSPFTVPDGFFESLQDRVCLRSRRIARRRRLTLCAAGVLVMMALFIPEFANRQDVQMDMVAANYELQQSLDSYEYDLFLETMFYSE